MKLYSAAIVLNKKKKWAKELARELEAILKENKIELLSPSKSQIIIAIGGDGTILYHKFRYHQPFFAIGSDSSFICNAHHKDWKGHIHKLIKNGFWVEQRTMLSSWLDSKALPDALNEVVIRNREHRILNLRLFVGRKKYVFQADGLLFSSATGSTSYAYSCGGQEMLHMSKKYQIVAIAPYRRLFAPLIVSPSTSCELHVDSTCKADAVIDGQIEVPVKRKCTLIVKVSPRKFLFVREKQEVREKNKTENMQSRH
ncbi:MAG: hypothetical protein V1822_00055 [Candidatus Micrarchaeota archaeon]